MIPTYQIIQKINECLNAADVSALLENELYKHTNKSKFFIDVKNVYMQMFESNQNLKYKDMTIAYCDEKISEWQEKEQQQINESKLQLNKLKNEVELGQWKKKTFWIVFILAIIGGIYSIIKIFQELCR